MPAKILPFVSRSEQLRLRSWRDYSRYMLVVKGFVAADSLERAQWQKEYAKDARRDAEWKLRHGPVGGVAKVLVWRTKANKPRNLTGKHTTNQPRYQGRCEAGLRGLLRWINNRKVPAEDGCCCSSLMQRSAITTRNTWSASFAEH